MSLFDPQREMGTDAKMVDPPILSVDDLRLQFTQLFAVLQARTADWLIRIRAASPDTWQEVGMNLFTQVQALWNMALAQTAPTLILMALGCVVAIAMISIVTAMTPLIYVILKILALIAMGMAASKFIGIGIDKFADYFESFLDSASSDRK